MRIVQRYTEEGRVRKTLLSGTDGESTESYEAIKKVPRDTGGVYEVPIKGDPEFLFVEAEAADANGVRKHRYQCELPTKSADGPLTKVMLDFVKDPDPAYTRQNGIIFLEIELDPEHATDKNFDAVLEAIAKDVILIDVTNVKGFSNKSISAQIS
jgi:hypothetical protein